MSNDIGKPWNLLDKKAYVKHDFRMSSQNHAQRKLDDKYNKDMFIYQRKYGKIEDEKENKINNTNNNNNNNKNGGHVWDGKNARLKKHVPPPPKRKLFQDLTLLEKMDDNSGAVLFVKDPSNMNGDSFQCKNGKIDFSKNLRNCNSIEILFDKNNSIFNQLNWKKDFLDTFNQWQNERDPNFNARFEFLLDTQLTITEPSKPTSYILSYPSDFLGDRSGDQFDLRRKMVYALEAYNYRCRKDKNHINIDTDQMYSINRIKSHTPENANRQWQRWLNTQLGQTFNEGVIPL